MYCGVPALNTLSFHDFFLIKHYFSIISSSLNLLWQQTVAFGGWSIFGQILSDSKNVKLSKGDGEGCEFSFSFVEFDLFLYNQLS